MSTILQVNVRGRWYTVVVEDLDSRPVRVLVDGRPVEVEVHVDGQGRETCPSTETPSRPSPPEAQTGRPASKVKVFSSPMPGVIVSVAVEVGDQVVTGDEICVLEAMKMQQMLRAEWSGIVNRVHVEPGQQVHDGDPIVELK